MMEQSTVYGELFYQKILLRLKNYRDSLETLAKILLEKETIDGDELKQFAEEVRVRASAAGERP